MQILRFFLVFSTTKRRVSKNLRSDGRERTGGGVDSGGLRGITVVPGERKNPTSVLLLIVRMRLSQQILLCIGGTERIRN